MEMDSSLLATPSLSLLFLLSFLAATILPIGSEWLLLVMILRGFPVEKVVATATFGNYLGACTTYLLGIWGADFFIRRLLRIDDRQLARAGTLYGRYGSWSLLLSWLPVVGDPLCLLAGIFRVGPLRFSTLVLLGKFFRYAMLAFLLRQGSGGSIP